MEGCSPAAVPGAAPRPRRTLVPDLVPSVQTSPLPSASMVTMSILAGWGWRHLWGHLGQPSPQAGPPRAWYLGPWPDAFWASPQMEAPPPVLKEERRCKAPMQRTDLTHTIDFHQEAQPHGTSQLDFKHLQYPLRNMKQGNGLCIHLHFLINRSFPHQRVEHKQRFQPRVCQFLSQVPHVLLPLTARGDDRYYSRLLAEDWDAAIVWASHGLAAVKI